MNFVRPEIIDKLDELSASFKVNTRDDELDAATRLGYEQGHEDGLDMGYDQGYWDGEEAAQNAATRDYDSGFEEGYNRGIKDAAERIIKEIPEWLMSMTQAS